MHADLNKLKRFILDLTLLFTSYMTLKKKSGVSAQKLIYLWPQRILTRKIKDDAYENSQKSLSDTSCYGLNLSLVLVIILGFKVSSLYFMLQIFIDRIETSDPLMETMTTFLE